MEDLKKLFGEQALTYDQFQQAVDGAHIKLADLGQGGYVSADKYNRLKDEFDKYKESNPTDKYADYDKIKAENDEYKRKEQEAVLFDKVDKAGIDKKFAKFVISEVSGQVTEKKDFDKCLKEYAEANPQFAVVKEQSKTFHFGSSVDLDGKETGNKSTNETMNAIIRGAANK